MIFPSAPHSPLESRWLPVLAVVIGTAFAAAAHAQETQTAQEEPAHNRSVAYVETTAHTAAPELRRTEPAPASAPAPAPAIAIAIAIAADPARAPEPAHATAQLPAEQPALAIRRIDIGSATQELLAMQRTSQGLRPRPIDGEQASRSYQRYLKSFETTIPEHYDTGLDLKKQ